MAILTIEDLKAIKERVELCQRVKADCLSSATFYGGQLALIDDMIEALTNPEEGENN